MHSNVILFFISFELLNEDSMITLISRTGLNIFIRFNNERRLRTGARNKPNTMQKLG